MQTPGLFKNLTTKSLAYIVIVSSSAGFHCPSQREDLLNFWVRPPFEVQPFGQRLGINGVYYATLGLRLGFLFRVMLSYLALRALTEVELLFLVHVRVRKLDIQEARALLEKRSTGFDNRTKCTSSVHPKDVQALCI